MNGKKVEKLAFFLPNTFTALNIGCGFLAIMFSIKGEFYKASMLIILGAIFDSVDGRVARITGTQSPFGEQFDSLSDLISFGMAPSLIYYNKFLIDYGRLGMMVSFIFLLCGALRLARFNANIDKVQSNYFQGLPIPGSAAALIGYILVSMLYPNIFDNKYITIPYILFYSVLMITNIPFPSFKDSDLVRKHKFKILFLMITLASSLFIYEELMIFIVVSVYILGSLLYILTHKVKFKNFFEWEDDHV